MFFAAAVLIFLHREISQLLINIALMIPMIYVVIVLHELGHGVGALLCRFDLVLMSFGSGRTVAQRRIGNTYLTFGLVPMEGLTLFIPRSVRLLKTRRMFCIAMGPVVNLGIAWFLWHINVEASISDLMADSVFTIAVFERIVASPVSLFMFFNLVQGAANLIPFKTQTSFGRFWSDGGQLVTEPFAKREELDSYTELYYQVTFMLALAESDHERCHGYAQEGLKTYPDNTFFQNCFALSLIGMRRYHDAIDSFRKLATVDSLPDFERAVVENNVAFAQYMLDDASLLGEADDLSQRAFTALPWNLGVRSTRSQVLIELGAVCEGIALLDDVRFVMESYESRADVACALVVAYARQGDFETARVQFKRAIRFDPNCPLISRAERALQFGLSENASEYAD